MKFYKGSPMQKLLNETKEKAYLFLREFGFEEDELEPVINKGLIDLENAIHHLSEVVEKENPKDEEVDGVLHGLKGLLFQLGNHDAANKAERLRYTDDLNEIRMWLDSF